jgi:hypothetical protein
VGLIAKLRCVFFVRSGQLPRRLNAAGVFTGQNNFSHRTLRPNCLELPMKASLDYFRKLSNDLQSASVGYHAHASELIKQINQAAAAVGKIEEDGGDATQARAELRQLKKERQELKAPSAINPLPDLEHYARSHSRDKTVDPVEIKIPNGQTPLAVHNDCANETNRILAEIERVKATPTSDVDISAKVDAIAAPPRIVNGELVWPKHIVNSGGTVLTVTNFEGVLAWLHRDELIAGLELAQPADKSGMTAEEKSQELAKLFGHFVKALRHEAAAAMAAEKAGQRVVRRRHVHPAILLGLVVSPMAVYDWFGKKRGV